MALVDQMYTVGPETSVDDCMVLITGKRIRHLPVFDNDKFVGIIAIGNIVKSIIAERETLIDQLAFVSFFRHPAEDGGMFHSRCILVVVIAGDELKKVEWDTSTPPYRRVVMQLNLYCSYFANESDSFRKKARFSSLHPRGSGVWLSFTITVCLPGST